MYHRLDPDLQHNNCINTTQQAYFIQQAMEMRIQVLFNTYLLKIKLIYFLKVRILLWMH